MANTARKATLEDAWEIVRELGKAQKETDRQLKESSFELKEAQKETDRQLKETSFELKEAQKETDRQLKVLGESQAETDRQLKKTDTRFNSQWGKLVESLVEGDLLNLFNQKNINVDGTSTRNKRTFNNKQYEFDIIAYNGNEVVVVEIKTTLDTKKVDHFIKKLKDFKKVFSEYANKKIYGAVAYIVTDEKSDIYSERKGLFVIKATGKSSSIVNASEFVPKTF